MYCTIPLKEFLAHCLCHLCKDQISSYHTLLDQEHKTHAVARKASASTANAALNNLENQRYPNGSSHNNGHPV